MNATYPKLADPASVTAACAARPDIAPYARIVGRWVWCEFPDKPSDETRAFLKQTGFRWNRERGAWQHPCGYHTRANRKIDPRQFYGALPLDGDYCSRDDAGPAPAEFHNLVTQ